MVREEGEGEDRHKQHRKQWCVNVFISTDMQSKGLIGVASEKTDEGEGSQGTKTHSEYTQGKGTALHKTIYVYLPDWRYNTAQRRA